MTTKSAALRGSLRKNESILWKRDRHDFYVEPEWCSERLFEEEPFDTVFDPACGTGRIVKSALKLGIPASGSDLVARGYGKRGDFLEATARVPNIVTNPPFGIAESFVRHALDLAEYKVAMLLPANWVQGDRRSRALAKTPLRRIWFIAPRPSMPPGAVVAAGHKSGGGTTDFAWFVWLRGYDGYPEVRWLHREAAE